MAAKAIGIGATMVGIGLPLLKAALESEQAVYDLLESYKRELRTAMICSGCATLQDLPERTRKSRRFLEEEEEMFNI
jgi:isopentenyl-diphosphate delta-isomerase